MADGFKRKRNDSAQFLTIDVVREPDDDPVDGSLQPLTAADIDIRIIRMEDGTEIINENVSNVVTTNPLQVDWKPGAGDLDVAGGDYGISLLVRWTAGEERFPVVGFIPLKITDNHENFPT